MEYKVDLEGMEAFAAQHLIEAGERTTDVTYGLATVYAEAPALSLCFTLTSVASSLEAAMVEDTEGAFPDPLEIYRIVGVLAADIFHLERIGKQLVTAGQLCSYWDATNDPHFRTRQNHQFPNGEA